MGLMRVWLMLLGKIKINTPLSRLRGTSPLNRGDSLVAHPLGCGGKRVHAKLAKEAKAPRREEY